MGQTNYSASKAGEIGFTKALAQENARQGITVNGICPGYINTEMVQAVPKEILDRSILPLIPTGRLGEPEEVARCVVFLPPKRQAYYRLDTGRQWRPDHDLRNAGPLGRRSKCTKTKPDRHGRACPCTRPRMTVIG